MLKRLKGVVSSIASGSEAVDAALGRKAAVLLLSLVTNRLRLRTIAAHLNRQRTSWQTRAPLSVFVHGQLRVAC